MAATACGVHGVIREPDAGEFDVPDVGFNAADGSTPLGVAVEPDGGTDGSDGGEDAGTVMGLFPNDGG